MVVALLRVSLYSLLNIIQKCIDSNFVWSNLKKSYLLNTNLFFSNQCLAIKNARGKKISIYKLKERNYSLFKETSISYWHSSIKILVLVMNHNPALTSQPIGKNCHNVYLSSPYCLFSCLYISNRQDNNTSHYNDPRSLSFWAFLILLCLA